jgi:hypothetical protein
VAGSSLALGAIVVIAEMTAPAGAEEPTQQAALAQQQRMRVLEARVQYLEEKLEKLERGAIESAEKRDQSDHKSTGKKSKTNGVVSANILAPASRKESDQLLGSVGSDDPVSASAAMSQTQASVTAEVVQGSTALDTAATSQTPAAVAADAVKESTPQETFVFRDQAPTLKKGQVEASLEVDYIHTSGFIQIDRIAAQAATIRYGLLDGLEISASLPFYESNRTTQFTPTQQYQGRAVGIDNATVGLNYNLINQTPDWPGLAMAVTGVYPGTVDPYNFSPTFSLGQNPIDILRSVQNSGHWGIATNLLAYKIIDPMLVFVGAGPTYWFPATYSGHEVEPAIRYSANVGFSFALSEKVTLASQFIASYQPDLKVSGVLTYNTNQEQYLGRAALTLQIFDKTWVEPSVAIGLTHESPAMAAGLTLRERW